MQAMLWVGLVLAAVCFAIYPIYWSATGFLIRLGEIVGLTLVEAFFLWDGIIHPSHGPANFFLFLLFAFLFIVELASFAYYVDSRPK